MKMLSRSARRLVPILLLAVGLLAFGTATASASGTTDDVNVDATERSIRCAQAARTAGWGGGDLTVAVAISIAESGCEPGASGYNPPTSGCPDGSVDRGAWQINDCYNGWVSDECAYELYCNAGAAHQIYLDWGGFGAWVTYNEGIYQQYMAEAQEGVDATA